MEQIGLNVYKLKPGTKLEVHTRNSVYTLNVKDDQGNCTVQGGTHVPEPKIARFIGAVCRLGGPVHLGWIMPSLGMEFRIGRNRVLATTSVSKAKVVGEGWDYDINWESL